MRANRGTSAVAICALVVLTGMIQASQPVHAAGPWYVALGGNDANSCLSPAAPCATINGAIGKATSGDIVYVAVGTYTDVGYEVVLLDRSLVLSGGWNAAFTAQEGISTIDGADAHRGITVNGGVTATVERFKVVRGGGTGMASGNGISNAGNLTLNASEVSSSQGGLYTGDRSNLTLNNSSVRANGGPGILINWSTEIILNGATIEGNTSGIYSHGGYGVTPQIILNNSTVSGNSEEGIALDPFGYSGPSNLYLNNATISGNAGVGIRTYWTGTAITRNSIIAGSTLNDCPGNAVSAGYNLIGNTSCGFTPGTGDLVNVDARLSPLIGTPGTARYHALLPGSPAIDAGNPAGCADHQGNPLPTDQRHAARVGRCDIGAYEYTAPGSAASIYAFGGTPQHAPPSTAFARPLQTAVLDGVGSPVSSIMVTFSVPTSGPGGTFAGTGTYTTTATTAETGVATAATLTANGLVGSYTATATVSGVVTPATFLLSNMTWYVAPGGSDGNTCQSPGQACATIDGTLNKADFVAGDTIRVATGTYTGTGEAAVRLSKNALLSGGWNGGFTAQTGLSTVDAQREREGIRVGSGVTATIERFDVRGGSIGIRSEAATLTLNSSTVSGNPGVGIMNVSGNLTLNSSTVSDNTSTEGAGIYNAYGSKLVLNNSTVSGNRASAGGGGIWNYYSDVTLNNSTISGNAASSGGGIFVDSFVTAVSTLNLNNSTISENTASSGGGLYVVLGPVTVSLQNTILAGNTASSGPDCSGTVGSGGYNLVGDPSGCTFTPGIGDLTLVNARLSPLIGPPGIPRYHPLRTGSPAIDAGNPAGCTGSTGPLATDQRGAARVGRCDIGAYEYTTPGPAASVYAHAGTPQRASPLRAFAVPLQAGVLDAIGSPVSNATVAFAAPASGPSGAFVGTGAYTTTATTGESGVATAATFTANGLVGNYAVTAAASGVVMPTNYLLTNAWLYVAPGGDDRSDCQRPANACATINGAVGKASPGDTIYVATGTYTWDFEPIALLDTSASLSGGWDSAFTAQSGMSTIEFDHGEECQGITVPSGISGSVERFAVHGAPICNAGVLAVDRCTITAGAVGIQNTGILTLSHSTVNDNHGDGIHNEGTLALSDITANGNGDTGVHNAPNSNATLSDVTLSGNTQRGIVNDAGATMVAISTTVRGNSRAGIWNNGVMTLTHSAVISNTTSEAGGGILNGGTLTLHNSTVSDNAVYGPGGGIYNGGTAILNNSTVSGNRTDPNSGGNGGGIYNGGTVFLNNSTVTDNAADLGGGILDEVAVTLRNTLVAGNRARRGGGPDCSGTLHSAGHNLIGDTSGCMFSATTGDRLDINAALFPSLVSVPGYHPLLFYSPAIDAGNPAGCADHLGNPLDADQRGVARVGRCDVGAYEFDPAHDPLSYALVPVVTRGHCMSLYADDFDDPGSGWPVHDSGDVLYEYRDGEYRILVRSAHWSALARPGFKASSYIVAVDLRHATLEFGTAGIVFGLADDWSQFYLFEVDAGSGYALWRYASGSGWRRLAYGYSPFVNPSSTTKRLKVDREGAAIRVYMDGHLLASVTDGLYTGSRHVGLYAAAYDSSNVDIRFDNFVVYPVQCGPNAASIGETSGTPEWWGVDPQSAGTWESGPRGTGW